MKFFYIIFILISFQLNAQWTSLIGDDLSNWRTVQGKAIFELNDGIISSASVLNSPNTFLITKDIYSDFILEFEVFVEEGLKITLRRSKTDQFGEGMVKGIPYFTNEKYCPVISLKNWINLSKIKTGPIFRRFAKGSILTGNRLTDQSVVLIIKDCLKLAGIENKNFSGHSLRSGFATVAAEYGADERSIMAMTGHKTTQMVRRYIRESNIFKNNALNKIKI